MWDGMVEMLNNNIAKEENKKNVVLRTWRRQVQELEKALRHLEDELDGSRLWMRPARMRYEHYTARLHQSREIIQGGDDET